jgi:CBS domain containing-hemolysin-like protein
MIVSFTEDIPDQGEVVVFEDYTFNIVEVSETKIELVEVKWTPEV